MRTQKTGMELQKRMCIINILKEYFETSREIQ